jgi:hypothetical protein
MADEITPRRQLAILRKARSEVNRAAQQLRELVDLMKAVELDQDEMQITGEAGMVAEELNLLRVEIEKAIERHGG